MLPSSAEIVLGTSTWSDSVLELPIFPADCDSSDCKQLVNMSNLLQAAGYQDAAPSSEAPEPLLCDTDAVLQRHFMQRLEQPALDLPGRDQRAHAQLSTLQFSVEEQWPLLEVPLLAPQLDGPRVWARCTAELMQSCSPLAFAALPEPDLAGGVTFEGLIAPCQVLSDALMMLPLVSIGQEPGSSKPDLAPHARIVHTLHLKPRNLEHLQLTLDWSLADPAAPDPSGRLSTARQKLRAELEPKELPSEHDPLPPMLTWSDLVCSLAGSPVCVQDTRQTKPEQLPQALRKRLLAMQQTATPAFDACAVLHNAALDAIELRAKRDSGPGHAAGQADESTCKRKGTAKAAAQPGCTHGAVPETGSKRARLQAAANDAAFFMGLHGATKQAAPAERQDQGCSSDDSLMGQ